MASLPIVKANNTNLAVIPDDWQMAYGDDPQIIFLDESVTHNGNPSVRIEAHVSGVDTNIYRENDIYPYISVSPGDHIIMRGWVKTGSSTLGQNGVSGNGAIFGFDFYSDTHRMREVSSSNPDAFTDSDFWTYLDDPGQYVPFNSDWSYRELDIIVPSQVWDESTGALSTEPITAIAPWMVAASYVTMPGYQQDQGIVWFSDFELYINPDAAPTPTPTPTATATASSPIYGPDYGLSNPDVYVQGDSFNILVEYQGGIAFQHDINFTFYIEVLDGVWDGRDCQLSMNERGGTLYFMSYNDCHIELYQDSAYTMGLTCEGMEVDSVNPAPTAAEDFYKAGYEWNGTITNGEEVRISWYFPRILPHEENWMLYLGLAGLFMLVIGILLTVYAFRHYKFFTLGEEKTVWERDVLPIAIVLILIGGGLLITWLLG